jgi:hypothetical protein
MIWNVHSQCRVRAFISSLNVQTAPDTKHALKNGEKLLTFGPQILEEETNTKVIIIKQDSLKGLFWGQYCGLNSGSYLSHVSNIFFFFSFQKRSHIFSPRTGLGPRSFYICLPCCWDYSCAPMCLKGLIQLVWTVEASLRKEYFNYCFAI